MPTGIYIRKKGIGGMNGKHHSETTKEKSRISHLGQVAWNKGLKLPLLSEEHKQKIKESMKNGNSTSFKKGEKRISKENHPMWNGGKPKCIDCSKVISYVSKRCNSCAKKGEKAPNWKGGITEERKLTLFYNRQRRNRELNAEGFHTEAEWMNLKIFYGFMCLCCKKSEPEIILTKDHIIPLTKNGTDFIENIQPLCKSCNCRKYNKIINYSLC